MAQVVAGSSPVSHPNAPVAPRKAPLKRDNGAGSGLAPHQFVSVAQLDRASGFGPEGCRFDSCRRRQVMRGRTTRSWVPASSADRQILPGAPAPIAQLEEHLTLNQGVPGSSPGGGTTADVAELVDAYGLGPYAFWLGGSSPSVRTKNVRITMKAQVERLGECKIALKIEVPADRIIEELDNLYQDLQKKAKLPGFRRGKVPLDVLKTYFARSLKADALDRLIPDAYQEALKENDFVPCSQPKIEEVKYEENKPLSFKATVEIKPEIRLKRYKGIRAKRVVKIVREEDVGRALERLASKHAEFTSIENRPAKKGDWVIIDFVGNIEGKPFKDNEAKNFSLEIGSKTLIGDFENQLIGLKRGEEKEIKVRFPKGYHNKELAGKEVLFKVNLKEIKEKKLPELNDEFAKDLKFNNLEELKKRIKEDLEKYETEHSERLLRNNLMDWLIKKTPFPLPGAMVERELEVMIEDALTRMRYSGLDPKRMGIEEAKLKEEYRPSAERKVKNTLILEEIAKQENIEINEQEIEKRIEEMALSTNQKKEDLRDFFDRERSHLAGLREEIRLKKALELIVKEARIKEVTQRRRK